MTAVSAGRVVATATHARAASLVAAATASETAMPAATRRTGTGVSGPASAAWSRPTLRTTASRPGRAVGATTAAVRTTTRRPVPAALRAGSAHHAPATPTEG